MRVLVCLIVLALVLPALAEGKRPAPQVELKVLKVEKGTSPNPEESLYEVTLQFTNRGSGEVRFNNNEVVLVDDQGASHVVNRLRNRQVIVLKPGESATSDRMYYQLSNRLKPASVMLLMGRNKAGEAKL